MTVKHRCVKCNNPVAKPTMFLNEKFCTRCGLSTYVRGK